MKKINIQGVQTRSTAPKYQLRNSFDKVLFAYDYSHIEPQWLGRSVQGVGYKVKNKS